MFPFMAATTAKQAMRCRISGVLVRVDNAPSTNAQAITELPEDNLCLSPTGTNTFWSVDQLALAMFPPLKSGFPYTNTLKVLQKWGPGWHFLGNSTDKLEVFLQLST
ncbi:Cystathionine gamma-synthase [Marasmius tenuissimus]|nr:Cystathionine gamma-synthase [Marasmius tenuissimus]